MIRDDIRQRWLAGSLPDDIWTGAFFKKEDGRWKAFMNGTLVATNDTLREAELSYLVHKIGGKGK